MARLRKRVFEIEMEHCPNCGGELQIIAAILEQPGDRENPHASGIAGPVTPALACPWPGAASVLTISIHHRSGCPESRATEVGSASVYSDRSRLAADEIADQYGVDHR